MRQFIQFKEKCSAFALNKSLGSKGGRSTDALKGKRR